MQRSSAPTHLQLAAARAALPEHIRVAAIPQDDSWFRDTGPTVSDPWSAPVAALPLPALYGG